MTYVRRAPLLMRVPPIQYVSAATTAPGLTAIAKPSGLEVGSLVLVWAHGFTGASPTLDTASGSAWTVVDNDNSVTLAGRLVLFAKVLTATDVANAWNLSESAAEGAVSLNYLGNGATTVTAKNSHTTGSNLDFNVSVTGFTKAAGVRGVLGFAISTTQSTAIGVPSGFTERSQVALNSTIKVSLSDNILGYVNGATATWMNFNTPAADPQTGRGLLVEVTGP
ncbi:hypothetical protein [Synechococcus phage Ssp-JY42]|nr:hypothetical protein [Synechococcus phage Yong-M4-211]